MILQFGENLKKLRRKHKITQGELASILAVTPQAISRWEKGTAYPQVDHFVRIAQYFSVSIGELVGEECGMETAEKNSEAPHQLERAYLDELIMTTSDILCKMIEMRKSCAMDADKRKYSLCPDIEGLSEKNTEINES